MYDNFKHDTRDHTGSEAATSAASDFLEIGSRSSDPDHQDSNFSRNSPFTGKDKSLCSPAQYCGVSPPICACQRPRSPRFPFRNELAFTKRHLSGTRNNNPRPYLHLLIPKHLWLLPHARKTLSPRPPSTTSFPKHAMISPSRSSPLLRHSPLPSRSPSPSWHSFPTWLARHLTT